MFEAWKDRKVEIDTDTVDADDTSFDTERMEREGAAASADM